MVPFVILSQKLPFVVFLAITCTRGVIKACTIGEQPYSAGASLDALRLTRSRLSECRAGEAEALSVRPADYLISPFDLKTEFAPETQLSK